jgi:hypothetical protein
VIWQDLEVRLAVLLVELLVAYKIGFVLNAEETLLQDLLVRGKR